MSKHHDELASQFDLLIGMQKEFKQSFDNVQLSWQTQTDCSSLIEIDQWEIEATQRIRELASKARTTVNDIMNKNLSDIRRRLDQLAFDMEQRQQEGNYLDNDITQVRKQLEQLNLNLKTIHDKIRINQTATKKIDWPSLIYVISEKKSSTNRFSLQEYHDDGDSDEPQDKLWNHFRRFIRTKHFNIDYRNRQSSLKSSTTSICGPTVLASFSLEESYSPPDSIIDSTSITNSNDDSFTNRNFLSIDHDHLLPQATDV